ncbi:MAG: VCBS repeat-containing protein [Hyphomicrobiales bacterium]|nr:VCBS repeat-containing protein [Hyphomicrobiales bacterium]
MLRYLVFLFSVFSGIGCAQAADWRVDTLKLPAIAERVFLQDNGQSLRKVRIRTRGGGWMFIGRCGENLCAKETTAGFSTPPLPAGALPDAEISYGKKGIHAAWLAAPTKRYDHGILGDAIEAGAIVAEDETRRRHTLELGLDSVFEDRLARLADLDSDGKDEIVVVRSYLDRGGSLAVLELTSHGLEIKAESPAIGKPNRWLNPAGIADFDGDGRPEIAVVVTPHIGGTLEFWEYRGGRLVRDKQLRGFSNHAIGSRVQEMSAVGDFDGDGVVDLALPGDGHRTIRLISIAKGSVAEIARIALPGRIVTEMIAVKPRAQKRPAIVTGLHTGKLAIIR